MSDDDDIWTATIPAGSLARPGHRARPAGLAHAVARPRAGGATLLALRTRRRDLRRADRTDHMVTVTLTAGAYRASHTRLWLAGPDQVATGRRAR